MSTFETTTVFADYHQFYLNNIGELAPEFTDTFLAHNFEGYGNLLLLTARQWGEISVEVHLHDARPRELDESWHDAAEASIVAQPLSGVSGWAGEGHKVLPDLVEGAAHRVRYAIRDGDKADVHSTEVAEGYRLDLWPEAVSPAVVIRQLSEFGRHWKESWHAR